MNVEIISYDDLPDDLKGEMPNNGAGKEYASYLVIKNRAGEVLHIESDAMEPEDANFRRDLAWIPGAIEAAYEAGTKDNAPAD